MAKLQEHFISDFSNFAGISISQDININFNFGGKEVSVPIKVRESIENHTGVHFTAYYFSSKEYASHICFALVSDFKGDSIIGATYQVHTGFPKDLNLGLKKNVFSNRIYLYTEYSIHPLDTKKIESIAHEKALHVIIRDSRHANYMKTIEKPLAFISHDSRDKDLVARPLASGLSSRLCTVWYDEFSLKIGDSLRKSIEKGIKEAKKCIVILSPNFINNSGWTQKEFDSIFTREMILEEKIILPIWYNISKREVYEYSPSLLDVFALHWPYIDFDSLSNNNDPRVKKYNQEKEAVVSKIHNALSI